MMTTQEKNSRISTSKLLETGISPRHQQLAECSADASRAPQVSREKSRISTGRLLETRIAQHDQALAEP